MKTYLHIKTGERYPENGVASTFTTWRNGKFEHHIRPGYAQFTGGWKKVKVKNWQAEEIPDLKENFTKPEWLEYASKYGTNCAQEFFSCCDYSKPYFARQMFLPPPTNEILWKDNAEWFKATFKRSIWDFADSLLLGVGNVYMIDTVKFERHLVNEFKYPSHRDGSMKDFMIGQFGEPDIAKFESIAFKVI